MLKIQTIAGILATLIMTLSISIITAVRNSVETIGACLDSVSRQFCFSEHIIIDGLSTDGSIEIIDKLRAKNSIFVSEPDKGFYDALNKGIGLASGDVIGILNADDVYENNYVLEKVIKTFNEDHVDSCYGDLVYVDAEKKEQICRFWRSGQYKEQRFYRGWMPPHPTFFVRKRIYEKYGGFNLELGTAADYELILRFLVRYKITTSYIPEVLVKMRMGGQSNSSIRRRIAANRMDRKAWKVNNLEPYPWTLFLKPLSKIGQYFVS